MPSDGMRPSDAGASDPEQAPDAYPVPDRSDPEVQRRLLAASMELRARVLRSAMGYGIAWSLNSADHAAASALLEWFEEMTRSVRRLQRMRVRLGVRAWMEQLRAAIRELEQHGSLPLPTVTDDGWRRTWTSELEQLALSARAVETFATEPLGEVAGAEFGEGVALLGALEDSLTLTLSHDETVRAQRMSVAELYERLEAALKERVWDFLEHFEEASQSPED